jgi:hypothetical protein
VVIGDQRPQGRLSSLVVVPDRRGEREDALQHPDRDPHTGAAAVAFQVQLALEGLVDRLDQLEGYANSIVAVSCDFAPNQVLGSMTPFDPGGRPACCRNSSTSRCAA